MRIRELAETMHAIEGLGYEVSVVLTGRGMLQVRAERFPHMPRAADFTPEFLEEDYVTPAFVTERLGLRIVES